MKTPISAKRGNLLIGTSGWSYRSWRGPFFPRDLPEQGRLEFYARQFRTTELNGVFYRTPAVEAVRGWEERTPEGFIFAWKASRFITHWKRLNDTSRSSLALLEDRLLLSKKVAPVLFQLPHNSKRTARASPVRYPIPGLVSTIFGSSGSSSILWRRRPMWTRRYAMSAAWSAPQIAVRICP